jgi:rare lipoprotein A
MFQGTPMLSGIGLCMRQLVVSVAAITIALAGCSSKKSEKLDPFAGVGSPYYRGSGPIPTGGGKYHVGNPYQVAGRWFKPQEQPNYDKTGTASWYGEAFHRRKTSNGEWFDMNDMTAAHPTLPLPSYAKVTNLDNGREIIVRINDRGPFVGTRIIDLSKRSADALGFRNRGKADVRVQWIANAPLQDSGGHLLAMNQAMGQGESVSRLRQIALRNVPPARGSVQVASVRELETPSVPYSRGFGIQVGSFANQSNALAAMAMVSEFADAKLVASETEDGIIYRTVIGPIRGQAEAIQILEQVQNAGFQDARLSQMNTPLVAALQ